MKVSLPHFNSKQHRDPKRVSVNMERCVVGERGTGVRIFSQCSLRWDFSVRESDREPAECYLPWRVIQRE